MLDYEWINPPPITAADDTASQPDPTRHIFDHYPTFTETNTNNNTHYLTNPDDFNPTHHYLHDPTHFTSIYDPRAYTNYYAYPSPEPGGSGSSFQTGFMLNPKPEPGCGIGLNLGGRTYFSSAEDEFVNRFYCRSVVTVEPVHASLPRCQAEGCNADLTNAKHYHRRHKVCEFHSKASTVIAAGLTQRFCQQCSRFHLLSEFDNGKRSCRRRLADHNRRRRKSSQNQDHSKSLVNQSISS